MERIIKIDDKELKLDNNVGWLMEYKSQFNVDILPTLMPLLAGITDMMAGLVEATDKVESFDIKDFAKMTRSEGWMDALVKLSSFEIVDMMNITWALAKTADESIPEPRKWVRELGRFPTDEIGPELLELVAQSVMSSKNFQRLQETVQDLKPKMMKSPSTQS